MERVVLNMIETPNSGYYSSPFAQYLWLGRSKKIMAPTLSDFIKAFVILGFV